MVALLRASDSDKPFVAVVLGFVDFDDGAGQLTDLVDFGASLSDDGTDHIVGDKDLLCQGLTGEASDGLRATLGHGRGSSTGLVGTSACILTTLLGGWVMDGSLRRRRGCLAVEVGNAVGVGGGALRGVVVLAVCVGVTVLPVEGLRLVGDNLHAAGNGASGASGARSVC